MIGRLREQILSAVEPLREQARPLFDLVAAVLRRDPSTTVQQQILVAAIVFVLVALVIMVMLIVFTPGKRKVLRRRRVVRTYVPVDEAADLAPDDGATEREELEAPTPEWRRTAARLALGAPGVALVIVVFLVASYAVSSTNTFCTYRCHQDLVATDETPDAPAEQPLTTTGYVPSDVATSTVESAHHERCSSCHSSGVIANIMDRGRMVVAQFASSEETSLSAVVSSRNCVGCHRAILDTVIVGSGSNVRMSHKEPYESGMACDFCHGRTGHDGSTSPVMSSCSECHDNIHVAIECATCHVGKPSDQTTRDEPQGSASKRVYRAVPLSSDRCYECHAPAPCDSCHRVRVPHTPEFMTSRHARDAAWDRKESCKLCHTLPWCQQCHFTFEGSHAAGWQQSHALVSPTASCSCHDRRNPSRIEPFCTVCHWTE